MDMLRSEGALMRETFGYATRMLGAEELRREYCDEREAAGALLEPDGIGIHPLKFSYGLMRRARALGAHVHPASPVLGWHEAGGVHHLRTPGGTVRAQRVAVCTGGYTGQALNPLLKNRLMPILSNSVVTRPLTDAELKATNFRSHDLPDRHAHAALLLPPARTASACRSAAAAPSPAPTPKTPKHLKLLTDAIARKFPPLAGIDIDALVVGLGRRQPRHDAAHHPPDPAQSVWYALGYGGNGVSFSTWAGKRLAERIAGHDGGRAVFQLPIYATPLEHPNLFGAVRSSAFAPFRRMGQRVLYRWYARQDEAA